MNSTPLSVVIAGGGTAGHIEPALAVGQALRERHGATVTALGTAKGLERDIIPARGFQLELITPVPLSRRVNGDLAKLPANLWRAVRQVRSVLRRVGADAVFGTGGYVAAPAYLAARSLHLPFYVLETNALAGVANKLGVRLGGVGLNAHANSGMPGEVVGIPVRPGLGEDPSGREAAAARERWGLREDRPVILVTGGSQGAASINAAVRGAVEDLSADYQILHAYGKKNAAPSPLSGYVPVPYIEEMSEALAVADLVVCRSGAMTVAEVSAAGLPAIFVPLPHGNGEQELNCRELVDDGAAVLIHDADLSGEGLAAQVRAILGDDARLETMRRAASRSAAGNVAAVVADRIAGRVKEAKEKVARPGRSAHEPGAKREGTGK